MNHLSHINGYEENAFEYLKQGEAEQQKTIDSYNNYDLKCKSPSSTASQESEVKSDAGKRLRENEEDGFCCGDVTEDDHGKKFIGDDDEFFEDPLPKKRKITEAVESKHEMLQRADSYEEHTASAYYDESTASMETYDDDFRESTFAVEEVSYVEDATDYRGDDFSAMY